MTLSLPAPLAAWLAAHNAHDVTAFINCFTDDAVVRDEGQIYFGRPSIGNWFESVSRKYLMIFQITDLTVQDGEPILHGQVSGNFEGSPLDMRYYLGLEDNKIVSLRIEA